MHSIELCGCPFGKSYLFSLYSFFLCVSWLVIAAIHLQRKNLKENKIEETPPRLSSLKGYTKKFQLFTKKSITPNLNGFPFLGIKIVKVGMLLWISSNGFKQILALFLEPFHF